MPIYLLAQDINTQLLENSGDPTPIFHKEGRGCRHSRKNTYKRFSH